MVVKASCCAIPEKRKEDNEKITGFQRPAKFSNSQLGYSCPKVHLNGNKI